MFRDNPPHNLDAEAAVLSVMLVDERNRLQCLSELAQESFYSLPNQHIYASVKRLTEALRPIDVLTVAADLRALDLLQAVGGTAYLGEIIGNTPAVGNLDEHIAIVRNHAKTRAVIELCHTLASEGYEAADQQAWLDESFARVAAIATEQHSARAGATLIRDELAAAIKQVQDAAERGGLLGTETRFKGLDHRLGGLVAGDLIILAARPGMGKSALAVDLSNDVLERGKSVLFWTGEMPKGQLALRMLAGEASVNGRKLRSHADHLTPQEWEQLAAAAGNIAERPLWLHEKPGVTLWELRAEARKVAIHGEQQGKPLGLIIVDYLQLMSEPSKQSREQEVAHISRGLKALAKELEVPVVALAQLNRGCEARQDKRPMLSDLRESGQIEQDADAIVFIYRDSYYERDEANKTQPSETELIVAKARNGQPGTAWATFYPQATTFRHSEGPNDGHYE